MEKYTFVVYVACKILINQISKIKCERIPTFCENKHLKRKGKSYTARAKCKQTKPKKNWGLKIANLLTMKLQVNLIVL